MENFVKQVAIRFGKVSILLYLFFFASVLFVDIQFIISGSAAYWLSFLFISSNFVVLRKLNAAQNSRFFKQYLIAAAIRFLLILAALIVAIGVIKFHQIFFTVSFIISYIFHSVIEIIFINKILEKEPQN